MKIHNTTCTCREKHLSSVLQAKYVHASVSKVTSLHLNYIRVIGVSANTIEKVSVVTEKKYKLPAKDAREWYNFPAPELWIVTCFYHPRSTGLVSARMSLIHLFSTIFS